MLTWTAAGMGVAALAAAAFLVPTWVSARQISSEDALGPTASPTLTESPGDELPIPEPSDPVTPPVRHKTGKPSPSPSARRPVATSRPAVSPSHARPARPSPSHTEQPTAKPTTVKPTTVKPTPVKSTPPPKPTPAPTKTTTAPKPTATAKPTPSKTAAPKPNPYTATGVCGSGYAVVDSHSYGQATTYLLYNASKGYNCVVTMSKYVVPGKIKMSAVLKVQNGSSANDSGSYTAYAGPVRLPAKGKCVIWGGGYGSAAWTSGWSHCS